MKYERSKVVMLPTSEASNIHLTKLGYPSYSSNVNNSYDTNQHLYILSDEEIKVGDWILESELNIPRFIIQVKSDDLARSIENYGYGSAKKIISTTDESLGLPRPSDGFVKKYCELGGIDEVLVECEIHPNEAEHKYIDGILTICPNYRLKVAPDNTITIRPINYSPTDLNPISFIDLI